MAATRWPRADGERGLRHDAPLTASAQPSSTEVGPGRKRPGLGEAHPKSAHTTLISKEEAMKITTTWRATAATVGLALAATGIAASASTAAPSRQAETGVDDT